MSVKRRDRKNRVLHNGESQRADGRYAYKYVDIDGKAKFIYSWKLVDTDKVPQGKRDCVSLREQKKEIQKQLDESISISFGKKRLCEVFEMYAKGRSNIKDSTKQRYDYYIRFFYTELFCNNIISNITNEKAREWIASLIPTKSYRTINQIKSILSLMYYHYINCGYINNNPFSFKTNSVVKNNIKPRKALTAVEQDIFLSFLENDSVYHKYYYQIKLLLLTGLRISELCGLSLSDIDFIQKTITVKDQLCYINYKKTIQSLKTSKAERNIPITNEIEECLRSIIGQRKHYDAVCVIDGKSDFLIVNSKNQPMTAETWDQLFKRIVNKYNKQNTQKLPNITPHILRHTYCSNQIKKGLPIKVVQYLMGHNDVQTTLSIYTHVTYEDVQETVFKQS